MKSIKIIGALIDRAIPFKASPWAVCLTILLAGTFLLGQGSDTRFPVEASADEAMNKYVEGGQRIVFGSPPKNVSIESPDDDELATMEEYVEMGRLLVFGSGPRKKCYKPSGPVTPKEYAKLGNQLIFGSDYIRGISEGVGRGRCPLCHTFDPGEQIGLCVNLYGIEERSHTRIKELRYLNEPISIGEIDKDSRIVKGAPDQIPEKYRREGSLEMTGEDYLRESMMCPSCYIVERYGKEGDTKSPMPVIHNRRFGFSKVELNAVIAWLQTKDTPGNYSRMTVPLPKRSEIR